MNTSIRKHASGLAFPCICFDIYSNSALCLRTPELLVSEWLPVPYLCCHYLTRVHKGIVVFGAILSLL
uniref:Uncharacterized protein n=1 Tax=Anguilla anguilla TaxID=7936 RepID=A0A0E9XBE3_ANGAN